MSLLLKSVLILRRGPFKILLDRMISEGQSRGEQGKSHHRYRISARTLHAPLWAVRGSQDISVQPSLHVCVSGGKKQTHLSYILYEDWTIMQVYNLQELATIAP